MTDLECRTITDRIDYIMPYVKDEMVKKTLEDIKFQCSIMKETKYVTEKKYIPDYSNDCEVATAVKLSLAAEIFDTMLKDLEITIQQFLGEFMYLYGLEPEDVYMIESDS